SALALPDALPISGHLQRLRRAEQLLTHEELAGVGTCEREQVFEDGVDLTGIFLVGAEGDRGLLDGVDLLPCRRRTLCKERTEAGQPNTPEGVGEPADTLVQLLKPGRCRLDRVIDGIERPDNGITSCFGELDLELGCGDRQLKNPGRTRSNVTAALRGVFA